MRTLHVTFGKRHTQSKPYCKHEASNHSFQTLSSKSVFILFKTYLISHCVRTLAGFSSFLGRQTKVWFVSPTYTGKGSAHLRCWSFHFAWPSCCLQKSRPMLWNISIADNFSSTSFAKHQLDQRPANTFAQSAAA